jgi:hypothetical protein
VAYSLTGGLVTICFFVAIISRSFSRLRIARRRAAGDRKEVWFLWCLGAAGMRQSRAVAAPEAQMEPAEPAGAESRQEAVFRFS